MVDIPAATESAEGDVRRELIEASLDLLARPALDETRMKVA